MRATVFSPDRSSTIAIRVANFFLSPHAVSCFPVSPHLHYTTLTKRDYLLSANNMASATQVFSSNASLPAGSYIYKIISTATRQDPLVYTQTDSLAFISSDDSLRFIDASTIKILPYVLNSVNDKVTCLERANDAPSNVIATAGRDGLVRFWDKRSREKALELESRTQGMI